MKTLLVLIVAVSLMGCQKVEETEINVLTNSAFYPGQKAAGFNAAADSDTDGGFIEGPGGSGSSDAGTIAVPNDSSSSSSPTTAGQSDSNTTNNSSAGTTNNSIPSSSTGTASNDTGSASTGGSTSQSSSSTMSTQAPAEGSDSGSISNPTANFSNGVAIAASTVATSGTGALMTSGAGDASGNTSGSQSAGSTPVTSGQENQSSLASATQSIVSVIQNIVGGDNSSNSSTPSNSANVGTDVGVIGGVTGSGGDTENIGSSGNASSGGSGGSSSGNMGEVGGGGTTCGTTGGNGSHGGCSNGGGDGGSTVNIEVSRICSAYRSTIPYPQFIFFEQAQHPLLTLELVSGSNYKGYKVNTSSKGISPVLVSRDMSDVSLFDGKYSTQLKFAVQTVQKKYPSQWKKFSVKAMVCNDHNHNGRCVDEVSPHMLSVNSPTFALDRIPAKVNLEVWNGRDFTIAGDPEFCEKQYSPLVLDLSGDGFSLTRAEKGVSFDLNATGENVMTAWVAGRDDAFLVLDRNGNGTIDDGSELFGSATVLSNGKRAMNGFEALKELDSNRDGNFNATDKSFVSVRLWIDRNHNGLSERNELYPMTKAQVYQINLTYMELNEVDAYGNETRQRSTFIRHVNGKDYTLQVIDIWFNTLVSH